MKLLASLAFLAGTAGAFNQPQSFGGTGAAAAAAGAGSGQRSLHPSPLMPESSPLLTMNSDNPFASKVNDLRMVAGGAQAEEYYEGALEIAPLVLRIAALVRLRPISCFWLYTPLVVSVYISIGLYVGSRESPPHQTTSNP